MDDAPGRYIEYVKNTLPKNTTFSGIKVVIDAANGAAYKIAPRVLWELGADVISIGCSPNGININKDCGSNYIGNIEKVVLAKKADIGIALDGDADRIAICDENGKSINGDHLIAMIAHYMSKNSLLSGGIVVTKVSNTALKDFLLRNGIDLAYSADIGDRSVMQKLNENGYNFGGEQSGHIIFREHTSTGDGLIAALHVLLILLKSGKKLSEISRLFDLYPQNQINVPFSSDDILERESIIDSINKIKKDNPNLLFIVRKSGTEKVIRAVVEGKNQADVISASDNLKNVLLSALLPTSTI